jgi:Ser/Thr protein kinase RdoA (MazF antagonist)
MSSIGALTKMGAVQLTFDEALPTRDEYLDAAAMQTKIGAIVGVPKDVVIEGCKLVRVKYRLGESLRVMYEIEIGGCRHVLTARSYPISHVVDPTLFFDVGVNVCGCGLNLRRTSFDPVGNAVWWAFPADRYMGHLNDVMMPPAGWVDAEEIGWVASELVEYRPEHSATVRCMDTKTRTVAFAKTYAHESMGHLVDRYNLVAAHLRETPNLRAPRALGWSESQRTLVLEAMPGTTWSQELKGSLPQTLETLGRAIATVHEVPTDGLPRFDRLDTDRVVHCTELIAVARPDVADLCRELHELFRGGPPQAISMVFLHGDVHPKNALQSTQGIALLDFDQAGFGPAAADVASLIAVLQHGAIVKPSGPFVNANELGEEFLRGYESIRALPNAAELQWFVAAALVAERAMRAVNRVNRLSLSHLDNILLAAIHTLQGNT